ncbi:major facilitator superfamily domain-containing protein 12-like [Glandiceps talaboti]
MPPGDISIIRRYAYGVGHVQNDLCASMWFSYLLIYFHSVLNFSNSMAGYLMLVGQVADAICTPFVGYESDRTSIDHCYGRRKIWHLVGVICVAVSFPFLFNPCITCEGSSDWAKFIYYAPFVVIFQFGWASTQISHLSLIPELTSNESTRVELNAIRYAFTVASNICVYAITWLLLDITSTMTPSKTSDDVDDSQLTPDDVPEFRKLAFTVIGIGACFSFIFHVGTKEKKNNANDTNQGNSTMYQERKIMLWKDWLKEPQFYLIALLYMCTRLMVNVSQVYIPMYLTDSLQLGKDKIAIIPLIVYISGFFTSFLMKLVNKYAGRKVTYLLGAILVIAGCGSLWFKTIGNFIYISAVLLGAGGSTVLVTSLSMTADLIADDTQSGAFVYGAMSFTDKLSNGIAVTLIQNLQPCITCCKECKWFYKNIMVFVPGGFAVLAIIILFIIWPQTIGRRWGDRKKLHTIAGSRTESMTDPEREPLLQDKNSGIIGSINT